MFIKKQKQDETGLRLKEKNINSYIVLLKKRRFGVILCWTLVSLLVQSLWQQPCPDPQHPLT